YYLSIQRSALHSTKTKSVVCLKSCAPAPLRPPTPPGPPCSPDLNILTLYLCPNVTFSPWLFAPWPPPLGTNRTTPRSFLSYLGNPIIIIAPYVPYRKKIRKEGGHRGKGMGETARDADDGP
ncbi:hypothetical protein CNYM01_02828, partial [Colletotrichum nymphaeae SA-01]